MSKFVIGVDSSTTSCKAIAWDAQGAALAEGRGGPFVMLQPQPNFYEQQAEPWWHGLCAALKDLGSKIDLAKPSHLHDPPARDVCAGGCERQSAAQRHHLAG